MALTFTELMGLPQWGAGSDVPTRSEFNDAFLTIDGQSARFQVGVEAGRVAGAAGEFYYATDTGVMWFFDGTDEASWRVVGRVIEGTFVIREAFGLFNLMEMRDSSGNVIAAFDAGGNLTVTDNETPTLLTLPAGVSTYSGFSAPGYYRTAEGLIKMNGALSAASGSTVNLSVPRPRDLANHYWFIPSGASTAIQAYLTGSIGQLQVIGLVGGVAFLDPISYIAER